jgi:hypothetical protein
VAEAAKVIENTQRDLNIALMNELAIIFDKVGIDTLEVLKAAGTKWNFLPFRPGLVGGHCIGVDPYYLTHKAEMVGYHPQVILAGRRINDGMAKFVAEKTVKSMISSGFHVKGSKVNVIGLTFKENCPDLRNSKVADIVHELESYGVRRARLRPGRRSRRSPARIRHQAGALGRPAEGRRPGRRRAAQGSAGALAARLPGQAERQRLLHRRQIAVRPESHQRSRLLRLAPVILPNTAVRHRGRPRNP